MANMTRAIKLIVLFWVRVCSYLIHFESCSQIYSFLIWPSNPEKDDSASGALHLFTYMNSYGTYSILKCLNKGKASREVTQILLIWTERTMLPQSSWKPERRWQAAHQFIFSKKVWWGKHFTIIVWPNKKENSEIWVGERHIFAQW